MNKKVNKKLGKSGPQKMAKPAKKMTRAPAKKVAAKSAPKKTSAKPAPKTAMPKAKKPAPMKAAAKAAPMKPTASKSVSNMDYTKILTPLDDRILVETVKVEKKSSSGLILIDSAPESYLRAKVLAVGRGKRNKFGKIRPLDVKMGDKVIYTPRIGNEIKVSGQDLFIIRESDVLGVIEE